MDRNRSIFKNGAYYSIAIFVLIGYLLSFTGIYGESPDYAGYGYYFDLVRIQGLDVLKVSRFEPAFALFSLLLTTYLTSNEIVYSLIVATSLLLKGWAIQTCSTSQKLFMVAAIFYLARYFPIHELTQLRAAVSIALTLAGSIVVWRGRLKYGILMGALAYAFHSSTLVVFPAVFLRPAQRWKVLSTSIMVFALVSISSGPMSNWLANIHAVFEGYHMKGFGDDRPNPISIQMLIDWSIIIPSLLMWSRLSLLMRRVVFLELIGMAFFYGAFGFPVIAHRTREFYSVFWVLYVVDGLQQTKARILVYWFVLVSIVFYFYLFVGAGTFFNRA